MSLYHPFSIPTGGSDAISVYKIGESEPAPTPVDPSEPTPEPTPTPDTSGPSGGDGYTEKACYADPKDGDRLMDVKLPTTRTTTMSAQVRIHVHMLECKPSSAAVCW